MRNQKEHNATKQRDKHKRTIIIVASLLALAIILGPVIINGLYFSNNGQWKTVWGATETLSYFGAIVSAIGTVILGYIASSLNSRFEKLSYNLQENTLLRDTYSTAQITAIFVYNFEGHNDLRILLSSNSDVIDLISIKRFVVYLPNELGSFPFDGKNSQPNSHNDNTGRYYSFDLVLPPNDFVQILSGVHRIRIYVEFAIKNYFGIVTEYSGEIMLNRDRAPNENIMVYFKCTDNFTNVNSIKLVTMQNKQL